MYQANSSSSSLISDSGWTRDDNLLNTLFSGVLCFKENESGVSLIASEWEIGGQESKTEPGVVVVSGELVVGEDILTYGLGVRYTGLCNEGLFGLPELEPVTGNRYGEFRGEANM